MRVVQKCKLYLSTFLEAPTHELVCPMYDLAYVSATITSQVTHLPLCHGISEAPSGFLPLFSRLSDSLIDCTFALVMVRHTMSFSRLCLVALPVIFKHEKQCKPRASTTWPHGQSCGRHNIIIINIIIKIGNWNSFILIFCQHNLWRFLMSFENRTIPKYYWNC